MATPLNRRSKTVDSETQRPSSSHTIVQRRVAQLVANVDTPLEDTRSSDPARRRALSLLSAQPRPAPCAMQEEASPSPRPKRSSSSIQRIKNADRFENKPSEDVRRDGLAQRIADTRPSRHIKRGSFDHSDTVDGCSSVASEKNGLGGPSNPSAEYEKMKREIETLKETLHESKKAAKRHLKVCVPSPAIQRRRSEYAEIGGAESRTQLRSAGTVRGPSVGRG